MDKYLRQRGFTFIELISALALGSLFTLATLWLYQGMKKLHLEAELQTARTQNLITVRRTIENAIGDGGRLCRLSQSRRNHTPYQQIWARVFDGAFEVHPAGQGHADLKPVGNSNGRRSADSDVLLVRAGALPATFITRHVPGERYFVVKQGLGLSAGELVMVCDEHNAALMEVERINGKRVTYRSPAVGTVPLFAPGAVAARYAPSVFYVGRNSPGTAWSLYRQYGLARTKNGRKTFGLNTEEIAEGIVQLDADLIAATNNLLGFRERSSNTTAVVIGLTLTGGFPEPENEQIHSFLLTTQGP